MPSDDDGDGNAGNNVPNRRAIVHAPDKFTWDNPAAWPDFIENFSRFLRISGYKDNKDEEKIDILLYYLGIKAITIYRTFVFDANNVRNYNNVVKKFSDYFQPRKNVIYHRAIFNRRNQMENESAEHYIRELLTLAESCDYGEMKDQLIRDRLVVGILDKQLSEELQLDNDLTHQSAMDKIRAREQIKVQQACITQSENKHEHVDAIQQKDYYNKSSTSSMTKKNTKFIQSCHFCAKSHHQGACPAYGKKCVKCGKRNHFAIVCKLKGKVIKEVTADSSSEEEYFIGSIKTGNKEVWRADVMIGQHAMNMKVDCGADVTCITPQEYQKMKPRPELRHAKKTLHGPDGAKLKVNGFFRSEIKCGDKIVAENIYVVILDDNLLGRAAANLLNLVIFNPKGHKLYIDNSCTRLLSINSAWHPQEKFPQLFKGLGKMKKEYTIKIKEGVTPVAAAAPRRIPHPLRDKTKARLDELEKTGVISKIIEPTQWCGYLVVVPKPNGEVRLTVDSSDLAKAVVRERIILPSVEETLAKMAGAKVFSKMDLKDGFWQIPLSDECKHLTSFITPWGRYCYNRLFMGCTSASEHFHSEMSEMLADIEGVIVHIDDLTVFGETVNQHDERLMKVCIRLLENGITLNEKKCKFRVSEIELLGYIVKGEGSSPNPNKVSAINALAPPDSKKSLKSFLAKLEFLRKFVPQMTDIIQPMSDLQRENVLFNWSEVQEEAFNKIKKMLTSSPVLTLYDPSKKHRVLTDASNKGLGGCLEQLENDTWKPVMYISRRLTDSESRYAIIEKEALGVAWACNKLEEYILGKRVYILTDHKPLVAILGQKSLGELSPRLQRMRMKLLRYDFTIEYLPGKEMFIPDLLSRSPNPLEPADRQFDQDVETFIGSVTENLPISPNKLEEIKLKQTQDPVLLEILQCVSSGFPSNKNALSLEAKSYWQVRHELTQYKGLLLYRSRIVIPKGMRTEILKSLHIGHMGIVKTKLQARSCVYWPGISRDIENVINSCLNCAKVNVKCKQPLLLHEAPNRPWERVCMDIAEHENKNYLVLYDSYSRYLEVKLLKSITSKDIIIACKSIFARHGIPDKCFSDNGRQFISEEFQSFAKLYGFKHSTSSPHYPQSNGQAEAGVKVFKTILKKCEDPYLGLLYYRATPIPDLGLSPAQLLMGRNLNTTLPNLPKNLRVNTKMSHSMFTEKNNKRRERAKSNFDNHHRARATAPLLPGAKVWISDLGRRGCIKQPVPGAPRSYMVDTNKGMVRRNIHHLVPIHNTPIRAQSPNPPPQIVFSTPRNNPHSVQTPAAPPRLNSDNQSSPTFHSAPRAPTPVVNNNNVSRFGRLIKRPIKLNL